MTISQFLEVKDKVMNTTFVIKPNGKGYYLDNGQLIPKDRFEKWHQWPAIFKYDIFNNKPQR